MALSLSPLVLGSSWGPGTDGGMGVVLIGPSAAVAVRVRLAVADCG